MNRRKRILSPLHFSQPANEPPAGGAPAGNGPLPGGVAQHSAAAQAAAAQQAPGDQQQATDTKPPGHVPVAELAQERQKRHELEAQLAATKKSSEDALAAIKTALGLGDAQSPEQLKAAAEAAKGQATAATAQLQVFKLAKDAGGDPHALLDSASFLQSLSKVDTNDPAAVTAAIKAAVESNKNLALQKVAPGGSRDASQGAGSGTTQPTMSDLIRAAAGK